MQKFVRLGGAAALIGLGVWGWFIFFPSPEKVIRSRLEHLAATISFESKDGILARGYSVERAAGYFTADVEVSVDVRGVEPMIFSGREEIQQRALVAARVLRALKVEFLDINVLLGPDQQTATANLTAKWTLSGDREFNVQEFNFKLKKVAGEWLIYRVETVKTLSQLLRLFQLSDGARRSRRFNARNASGPDVSCAAPQWTLKRAEARAPFASNVCHSILRSSIILRAA